MTLMGIWGLKKIALRNLARHKLKTFITVFAIMISVSLYIFMDGLFTGMGIESRRNIVNFEMGAAKLQTRAHFQKRDNIPSYENFAGWEIYRDVLEAAGYNVAPRFVFAGTLLAPGGSAPVVFNAVDPNAEARTLFYGRYVGYPYGFGRNIRSGHFEMVLGVMAAERLGVGIPQRPLATDLEELIGEPGLSQDERNFIRSLYEPLGPRVTNVFAPAERNPRERMGLRRDASHADLDRFWDILDRMGRNNVNVSARIDVPGVPERLGLARWQELMDILGPGEQALMHGAYYYDEFIGAYLISDDVYFDDEMMALVLETMLRAEFSGALRHIHQLFSAVVVGVVNSPDPAINGNVAFVPMDVMQGEEGMLLEGHVTELLIRHGNATPDRLPGRNESAAYIAAVLENGLAEMGMALPPGLAVFSWMDYSQDYLGYETLQRGAGNALSGLLLLLAFLGISNTILLAVLERTKEIGMMRAMGMTDGQMVQVYMLEAGFLGFFGAVLGIIVGCLINYPMVVHGIDVSAMGDALGGGVGFRVTTHYRSMWNIPVIIGSGVVATIVASLMAFIPTRRAVKMPITDSLRFE
ncbi:MAG: FtsX-like permease family protein [Treponema sp.]|nr:FtsX-like permease family protein [Treponema sp.]